MNFNYIKTLFILIFLVFFPNKLHDFLKSDDNDIEEIPLEVEQLKLNLESKLGNELLIIKNKIPYPSDIKPYFIDNQNKFHSSDLEYYYHFASNTKKDENIFHQYIFPLDKLLDKKAMLHSDGDYHKNDNPENQINVHEYNKYIEKLKQHSTLNKNGTISSSYRFILKPSGLYPKYIQTDKHLIFLINPDLFYQYKDNMNYLLKDVFQHFSDYDKNVLIEKCFLGKDIKYDKKQGLWTETCYYKDKIHDFIFPAYTLTVNIWDKLQTKEVISKNDEIVFDIQLTIKPLENPNYHVKDHHKQVQKIRN